MQPETQEAPLTQEVTTETIPTTVADVSEVEAPQTPAPAAQVSPEMETKARDMGWVPQNEWRGSPDVWRPADQFVKRGEEVLPIIRSNLERERKKNHDLEKTTAEKLAAMQADFDKRLARNERMNGIALEKQRDQIWNEYENKKEQANEAGDNKAYRELRDQQHRALADFHSATEPEEPARTEPKPTTSQPQSQAPPEVYAWVSENRWFNSDPALAAFATKEHGKLLKAMPGLSIEENLRRTLDATKQKFPEEFGLPASNGHAPPAQPHAPSVEGGGRQAQSSGREKGWSDIAPEDRKIAERVQLQYFLPKGVEIENASAADLKKARDEYAREYHKLG